MASKTYKDKFIKPGGLKPAPKTPAEKARMVADWSKTVNDADRALGRVAAPKPVAKKPVAKKPATKR